MDNKNNLVKVGAVWLSQDRTYMSGKFGDAKLLIFKNKFKKEGSKQPDFNMFVAPYEKNENGNAPADYANNAPANNPPAGNTNYAPAGNANYYNAPANNAASNMIPPADQMNIPF